MVLLSTRAGISESTSLSILCGFVTIRSLFCNAPVPAGINLPIITFVDTPGAYPGIGAEERGQAEAIAKNLMEMAVLPVPILVIVIGEGASGGALGMGVGDRLIMLENTWFSVISPEG